MPRLLACPVPRFAFAIAYSAASAPSTRMGVVRGPVGCAPLAGGPKGRGKRREERGKRKEERGLKGRSKVRARAEGSGTYFFRPLPFLFPLASRLCRSNGAPNDRLASNREIHRVGDETFLVRLVMQPPRGFQIRSGGDRYPWPQRHFQETPAAVRGFFHDPARVVLVVEDDDLVDGAQMQIPEHVAGRKRRDQQFFRVVARGVAAKRGVG